MQKKIIATAIDFRGDRYALCWLPDRRDFAHWMVGAKDFHDKELYYLGRYFLNLNDAIDDFKDRVNCQHEETKIDWKIQAQKWNEAQVVLYFELDKDLRGGELNGRR